jgi:hypothetical protein
MNNKTCWRNEIINRYAKGPELIQQAVRGLSEKDLDLFEDAGTWTIREYVHHITDGDDIWKPFIKRALGNPNGVFDLHWYTQVPEQEYWSQAWAYKKRTITPSLALFRANRAHIVQLLRLIPDSLEKRLVVCFSDRHEEMTSVQDIVEMQTHHVEGHIADIQRILAVIR